MSSTFLQRMGMFISKVVGDEPLKHSSRNQGDAAEGGEAEDTRTPEQKELDELKKKGSEDVASVVGGMLPRELWADVAEMIDMTCPQMGGAKIARLYDICASLLDDALSNLRFESTERFKSNFSEESRYGYGENTDWSQLDNADRYKVLKLFLLMAILVPIQIKRSMQVKDVEVELWAPILDLIVNKHKVVTEVEADLVLVGVFYPLRVKPGNPILDIFHDALQLETSQYDKSVDKVFLRTPLAKESSFFAYVVRRSRANICPGWIQLLSERWDLTLFNLEISARAGSRSAQDCF